MLVEVSASVTKSRNGLMKKETSKTGFEISLERQQHGGGNDDKHRERAQWQLSTKTLPK